MKRPEVISWLLEHRHLWSLSKFDLVPMMQREGLLSRQTNICDVNIGKLIDEAKISCGEKKAPIYYVDIQHYHQCPDCAVSYQCITPECPYPEEYRCERCFRLDPPVGTNPESCRFEETPLHCSNCGAFIGELGTCEDYAFCRHCEKTVFGSVRDVKRKSDVVMSPEGGPGSRLRKARVNRV